MVMNFSGFADFCLCLGPARCFCCPKKPRSKYLSDSFFMVKGAALFLQQGNSPQGPRSLPHPHKHAGDLPQHLQVMINLLRCEDRIKLAVRLESAWADRVRYMVVVYSNGRQDTEENILLGVDFSSKESKSCTIGMVLRLWSDTKIHLDGDGGFSVSTAGKMHIFKPVSVQAMWSALQILHKACEVARRYNYFPGGMALVWATYYESCIASEQSCLNEWNAMQDLESTRPDSPALYVDKPTERERAERLIKAKLRSIMMSKDLENITSKEIRNELEKQMSCNLKEFKEFIDNEMLLILGQMDKPSLIFDHLYLGSEWNASNLEELRGSGVDYILNVTREIDNFFPGMFAYHNIRVYDEETTDLLAHWNEAYRFINKAKRNRSKCLVHCKMGVSRSASTVIAYAMKEFGWSLEKAYNYVKQKRSIARPNAGFMRQLQEYQGILDASKQRHNKLWKQQPEDSFRQSLEGQGGVGSFFLDSFDVDLDPPAFPPTFPDPGGSEDPRDFHDRFRSLSDSLPGSRESFFQVEDLEREVLLEEAESAPSAGLPLAELSEGSQAEQPKAEEKADLAALGERKSRKKQPPEAGGVPRDGALPRLAVPEEEDSREEKTTERWKRRSSFQEEEEEEEEEEESRLNCENVNNNNSSSSSSSSKRSCPEEFEHDDALFGILYKVKAPYKSCAECMYPSVGPPGEAFGEPQGSPRPAPRCRNSAVCTQPSFLPPGAPAFPQQPFCPPPPRETRGAKTNSWPSALAGSDSPGGGPGKPEPSWATCEASEKTKEAPKAPGGGALLGGRHSLGERGPTLLPEESKEDAWLRKESRPAKDLKCFLFGKEPDKPPTNSYLMQHQESLLQLQKAGLVRKHTKELERLKSFPAEPPAQAKEGPGASIPEETPELAAPSQAPWPPLGPPLSLLPGEAEGSPKELPPPLLPPPPPPPKTSTPVPLAHTSTLAKDFLKTVCYTPSSSSRSSNLTRSSSSDSLHSVRGKPGLVRQRAQEIETRLRLAGLTISSPLKRSHSLAKLGSLNLSSEDLSGEAELSVPPPADSGEAQRREPFLGHGGFPSFPKSPGEGPEPSAKPSLGKLKAVPWMEKS